MHWYTGVLKQYAVFSGRAQRAEFWWFVLFNVIISAVLTLIDRMLGATIGANIGILSSIYSLAVLIPSIAVAVRRLHDTGRSGWWLLIGLVPIIGWIALIIFYVQDSEPGDNQFGPNPKGASHSSVENPEKQ